MSFCGNCNFECFGEQFPEVSERYLGALEEVGIVPTGKGPELRSPDSPFRLPWPRTTELCCLDAAVWDRTMPGRFDAQSKTPDPLKTFAEKRRAFLTEIGLGDYFDEEFLVRKYGRAVTEQVQTETD